MFAILCSNPRMKELMAGFLFNRPFEPSDPSNKCNPQVASDLHEVRTDPTILSQVKELRSQFLTQEDCLCHGDFSTDNVLVNEKDFKVGSLHAVTRNSYMYQAAFSSFSILLFFYFLPPMPLCSHQPPAIRYWIWSLLALVLGHMMLGSIWKLFCSDLFITTTRASRTWCLSSSTPSAELWLSTRRAVGRLLRESPSL